MMNIFSVSHPVLSIQEGMTCLLNQCGGMERTQSAPHTHMPVRTARRPLILAASPLPLWTTLYKGFKSRQFIPSDNSRGLLVVTPTSITVHTAHFKDAASATPTNCSYIKGSMVNWQPHQYYNICITYSLGNSTIPYQRGLSRTVQFSHPSRYTPRIHFLSWPESSVFSRWKLVLISCRCNYGVSSEASRNTWDSKH